jgi:hypothetical protein
LEHLFYSNGNIALWGSYFWTPFCHCS